MTSESLHHERVGVAIAVHDSRHVLQQCLDRVGRSSHRNLVVSVCDDGSTDGTAELLATEYPNVVVVPGDGDLWWAGGSNRAIASCLERGAEYVLLLNPDVFLEEDTISILLSAAKARPGSVVSAVTVESERPEIVVWGGCRFEQPLPLVWCNRYRIRPGEPVSRLPSEPYPTAEVHGRGVLFPADLLRRHGCFDATTLPHYGADVDLSHRLSARGVALWMIPEARVQLDLTHTGLGLVGGEGVLRGYLRYLTDRKRGEALRVWWHLTRRHVPRGAQLTSYAFVIALNTFRYWQRVVSAAFLNRGDQGDET